MTNSALIMMLSTQIVVSVITIYFFIRMLTTKPKPEPDSFSENDDEERS